MIELLLNAENALALGLLDQAERIYRTVLEADPRNGIAAVGLSRVALERGDDAGAHALARAALEIDPENATARRMIDRLDEVARYRDAARSGRRVAVAAPPEGGAAAPADGRAGSPAPADAGAATADGTAASEAMIPAFAVAHAPGDPVNDVAGVPVAPDDAQPELAKASSSPATPVPGGSAAVPGGSAPVPGGSAPVPGGSAASPVHESSPGRRDPGHEPAPSAEQAPSAEPGSAPIGPARTPPTPSEPASPTAAANRAAPARPGLLRRILRRS